MKRFIWIGILLFIISFLQAGQRYVLGELFTLEDCPSCVPARSAWQDMITADDTQFFIPLMWQLTGPHQSPGANTRFYMYSEQGYTPHAEFSGILHVIGSGGVYYHYHQNYEQIAAMDSPIEMNLQPRFTGDYQLELTCEVTATDEIEPGDYRIMYVITYYDGSSYNSSVFVKTTANSIELPDVDETVEYTTELEFIHTFTLDQLKAVAFVQNWDDYSVLQATQTDFLNIIYPLSCQTLDFGEVETGETASMNFIITNNWNYELQGDIYSIPNFQVESNYSVPPFSQQEVTINFCATETGTYSGDIILTSNDPQFPTLFLSVSANVINTNNDQETVPNVKLLGNYPNPFNPETKIHYNIEIETKPVYLEIYNCKGRLIKKIHLDSSQNHVLWDGTNQTGEIVGSGIYFYKISQKKNIRKMVLLK